MSETPTKTDLQNFAMGKLDPRRQAGVEAYIAQHPERLAEIASAPDDELVRHLRGAGELPAPRRQALFDLAIEAVLPVVAGCAGVLAGGSEGGLVGLVGGQVAEKAINFFGGRIVSRWMEWLKGQPPEVRMAALTGLADVSPEAARLQAAAELARRVPQASEADRRAVAAYLGAIPYSVRQSLLSGSQGGRTLPPTISSEDSVSLLQLLPASTPPYAAPCLLPGTGYLLEELIGCGGFGAVYRASLRSEQYLNRAIKFCLDRSLVEVLRKEKDNLERLIEAGGKSWSPQIVRLFGYDLEHSTPYLVYEHVSGGDLVPWLERRKARTGRSLTPAEVLALIVQVTEGLAFAHERGIVHRDLKPANVLVEDEAGKAKLADFGIGGISQVSRPGMSRALSAAEQVSLFRGAGTPLYADPEQKEGKAADPRHDLYSLGVMWYQLLVGDVRREMRHGWERELERGYSVPREQIQAIGLCVGWIEERPKDAVALLAMLPKARTVETGKIASVDELRKWRDELVRGIAGLSTVKVNSPKESHIGVAIFCAFMACFILVMLGLTLVGVGSSGGWVLVVPGAILGLVGSFLWWLVEQSRKHRSVDSRAAIVSTIESALSALSLPAMPTMGDDALGKAALEVVRQIEERYPLPLAEARLYCAENFEDGDVEVYIDDRCVGKSNGKAGIDISVELHCGPHVLHLGDWEFLGRVLFEIPGEEKYLVEFDLDGLTMTAKVVPSR